MTEKELVATAFYARSCMQGTQIAHILGKTDDETRFAALRDRVIDGFLQRFTNLDGTMTSDTQCAYALLTSTECPSWLYQVVMGGHHHVGTLGFHAGRWFAEPRRHDLVQPLRARIGGGMDACAYRRP